MQSQYLLLLNLFPDQVDRFGSISNIQESLISALQNSPDTTLIYNADDPNCQMIADVCPNATIAFGALEKISNTNDESNNKCPECQFDLTYKIHQYAQLGQYRCPNCGFNRAGLNFGAKNISLTNKRLEFDIEDMHFSSKKAAEYVCYNLIGFISTVKTLNCDYQTIASTIKNHKVENGRMQSFKIDGKNVMINLAKNPVGFNQNIAYATNHYLSAQRPPNTSIAFFVNAREGDGRSTDWLDDVNFAQLADLSNMNFYYGGEAGEDLQKRLKKAGINAQYVENAKDVLAYAKHSKQIYFVANYTAMFPLRSELIKIAGA